MSLRFYQDRITPPYTQTLFKTAIDDSGLFKRSKLKRLDKINNQNGNYRFSVLNVLLMTLINLTVIRTEAVQGYAELSFKKHFN